MKKLCCRVVSCVVLLSGSVSAVFAAGTTPAPSPNQGLRAEDVFKIRSVRDAQISPDGRRIVFEQSAGDIKTDRMLSSLWIIDAAGGTPQRLVDRVASSPHWSPDSSRVAYLSDDSNGNGQIHIITPSTGQVVEVTHIAHAPDDVAWSPDGRSLAFASFTSAPTPTLGSSLQKPEGATWAPALRFYSSKHYLADGGGFLPTGHTHLFIVSVSGGDSRQVTFGNADDAAPVWTPAGDELVFTSEDTTSQILDFDLHRIWRLRLADGGTRQLSPDPIDASSPAISPDGQHIAFVGYHSEHPGDFPAIDLYVMDRDGSHSHVLDPRLDRVPYSPQWTSDGRAVLITYADRGTYKLAQIGMDGQLKELATDVDGTFSVSRLDTTAFPLGGSDHPDDLGTFDGHQQRRLTHLNESWLQDRTLGEVKPLQVRSSLDGANVGAWAIFPPGYVSGRRYPTILEIHGGPYGEDTPYWRTNSQLFAAAGYVVLYANYRGSTSYGLRFSRAIDRNFPGPAYDDLISVVNTAVRDGFADPARLFVTGASAGGELTAWIVGKTSRFRAAVAVKPVINELNQVLENDQYLYGATSLFATTPWESPMTLWQHSPLALVANVSTPTLLMVGEEDRRTPLDQSLQFYNALQIRGVPCGLVVVPGASHESLTSRPSQRAAEDLATLAWFAQYGGPAADHPVP